jgi:cyclopropane fatty-acyl-phospholipid synthase-like methyltransferase
VDELADWTRRMAPAPLSRYGIGGRRRPGRRQQPRQQHEDQSHRWLVEEGLPNVRPPLPLDVSRDPWPEQEYDGIFSANTVHIMGWDAVQDLFTGVGRVLAPQGRFCLYGPFNYQGRFTSESNARFDQWLKARDPRSGVRNFEDLDRLASEAGMSLLRDHAMPANNRTLVWAKKD